MKIIPSFFGLLLVVRLGYADPASTNGAPAATTPQPETWKTSDGKVYEDVTVVKIEDDAVTILDNSGGARVLLSTLPPDLQQKFHYDPVKAQAAAARYAEQQKASDQAFAAEQNKQQTKHQQDQVDVDTLRKAKALAIANSTHLIGKIVSIKQLDSQHKALIAAVYDGMGFPTGQMAVILGMDDKAFADGDSLTPNGFLIPTFYYAGTTQYVSVTGAEITCRVYSPDLDTAIRNLLAPSK